MPIFSRVAWFSSGVPSNAAMHMKRSGRRYLPWILLTCLLAACGGGSGGDAADAKANVAPTGSALDFIQSASRQGGGVVALTSDQKIVAFGLWDDSLGLGPAPQTGVWTHGFGVSYYADQVVPQPVEALAIESAIRSQDVHLLEISDSLHLSDGSVANFNGVLSVLGSPKMKKKLAHDAYIGADNQIYVAYKTATSEGAMSISLALRSDLPVVAEAVSDSVLMDQAGKYFLLNPVSSLAPPYNLIADYLPEGVGRIVSGSGPWIVNSNGDLYHFTPQKYVGSGVSQFLTSVGYCFAEATRQTPTCIDGTPGSVTKIGSGYISVSLRKNGDLIIPNLVSQNLVMLQPLNLGKVRKVFFDQLSASIVSDGYYGLRPYLPSVLYQNEAGEIIDSNMILANVGCLKTYYSVPNGSGTGAWQGGGGRVCSSVLNGLK